MKKCWTCKCLKGDLIDLFGNLTSCLFCLKRLQDNNITIYSTDPNNINYSVPPIFLYMQLDAFIEFNLLTYE